MTRIVDFSMVAFVLAYVAALIFIPGFLDHHDCVLQADQAACERITVSVDATEE